MARRWCFETAWVWCSWAPSCPSGPGLGNRHSTKTDSCHRRACPGPVLAAMNGCETIATPDPPPLRHDVPRRLRHPPAPRSPLPAGPATARPPGRAAAMGPPLWIGHGPGHRQRRGPAPRADLGRGRGCPGGGRAALCPQRLPGPPSGRYLRAAPDHLPRLGDPALRRLFPAHRAGLRAPARTPPAAGPQTRCPDRAGGDPDAASAPARLRGRQHLRARAG